MSMLSEAWQTDLFGSLPPDSAPVQKVQPTGPKAPVLAKVIPLPTPAAEPERKFDFAWAWLELLRLEEQDAALMGKKAGVWSAVLGPELQSSRSYSSTYQRPTLKEGEWDDGIKSAMFKHADTMLEQMVRVAEREFGVPGAQLSISTVDLHKEFRKEHYRIQSFDPQAAWRFLEKKYGGEQGKLLAYRQHADALAKHFSIHYQQPEWKRGMMVISDRMFHEDDFHGNWKLSYNYQREVYETLKELIVFFEWNKQPEQRELIEEAQEYLTSNRYKLQSRRKLDICPGLEIVTYKEKYEYWFNADTAQALQIYLSTYASPKD